MTQNIYDDPAFFEAYGRLPRSVHGLAAAPEWPSLRALLPPLAGVSVLDLGCGYGWFCRWAREQGAGAVLGVDVSERMLARAAAQTDDAAIRYERADLEQYRPPAAAFQLVYSSLVLHYVHDVARLLREVHSSLVEGGRFVFSIEHPLLTAPRKPDWLPHEAGHSTWPLDNYYAEGPRATNWLADGVIKQHRTLASYVNLLLDSGFALAHLDEWAPSAEQVREHPEWSKEVERPSFLLVAAQALRG